MITGFVHQVQLSVLVKAVGMGYFLGIFFYILTFLIFSFGNRSVAIFIRDVLFFISAAFLSFLFSLKYCSGMIRFYVAAGELIGYIIFCIYPGKQILNVFNKLTGKMAVKTQKIRSVVRSVTAEKSKKVKDYASKKKGKLQSAPQEKSKKMYIADMTKKLLNHTKKSQKN